VIDEDFPPYIIRGSPEEANWRARHPHGWKVPSPSSAKAGDTKPEAHAAAQQGDVEKLAKIAAKNARLLQQKDKNGWQPLHEATRAGSKEAVEFLVNQGVDVNARTWADKGSSALNLAIKTHGENHPVVLYLHGVGAEDYEPEL
jgi:prolyl 4-hydroxylase